MARTSSIARAVAEQVSRTEVLDRLGVRYTASESLNYIYVPLQSVPLNVELSDAELDEQIDMMSRALLQYVAEVERRKDSPRF